MPIVLASNILIIHIALKLLAWLVKWEGRRYARIWRQGNVDCKKVPELQGCDFNLYRGATREEVRITIG